MLPLAQIEMDIIFHGNQSLHGCARNAGKLFLKKMKWITFKKHCSKLIMKQWRYHPSAPNDSLNTDLRNTVYLQKQ